MNYKIHQIPKGVVNADILHIYVDVNQDWSLIKCEACSRHSWFKKNQKRMAEFPRDLTHFYLS